MLLPAVQYGNWKDVRPRMKAIVRRLRRGEGFLSVMTEGGMLDTATTDGFLIIGGTMRSGWVNFHCHEPWKLVENTVPSEDGGRELEDRIFQESMTTPWGVLGLMAPTNSLWFAGRPDRDALFLEAALRMWDEIDAVGERYFTTFEGERMWAIPNSLQHVLARLGVPNDKLDEPLPNGGPAALLKYAKLAS